MLVSRWLRASARLVLGAVVAAPLFALPLSVLLDRGPAGETRVSPHFFPLVLWLFDDFAWTCARNSAIFALIVSVFSLVAGSALGWIVAGRRFWGRGLLYGLVLAPVAISPAFHALGLVGLLGSPRPWPWPWAVSEGIGPGASLESWLGLPLWIEWIWTTVPWGVALVALATAATVEQLQPSWGDAARLTGISGPRAWRALLWPLVRPRSASAAAVVFVFALTEPGAPLVLGLRRTLAFQIVEAASRPDPFPAAAVWAVMTGLFGLAGWLVWRWGAGPTILDNRENGAVNSRHRPWPQDARRVRPLALTVLLAGWALIGWLPLLGLVRLTFVGSRAVPLSTAAVLQLIGEHARQMAQPPVARVLANSVFLGLEIALVTIAAAWLTGPATRGLRRRHGGMRLVRLLGCAPPLVHGVGFLALPWLAGLASTLLVKKAAWQPLAHGLGALSAWLDRSQNPWITMSCCVALALAPCFVWFWHAGAPTGRGATRSGSARGAALLAGAGRVRAARLGVPVAPGRYVAGVVLVCSFAATNLTPALLFERWPDGRTLVPAVVRLAAGPDDARSQAAALALCAMAINLAALGVARASSALPRSLDLE